MRYLILFLLIQVLFCDPFYYGTKDFGELKLFGILHTKANINGNWVMLNAKFTHAQTNFKLLALQDSCVIVENTDSKNKQRLCKEKPKFIKKK
ncbi:hypothetical protein [Helicobacter turcicus]|uniref:Secreted protein n=1 Tax=Helicobacter turcicus TaxID=2867412 RepID=A0ABS7JP39_9HELI|nr:hypothetical protein [Helicobacter turcicus]MBX7491138.1 hypothetical protein [Helicobacter turcicus]MBX7546004.1 hypothetical protein [Helicobacter turcicus]